MLKASRLAILPSQYKIIGETILRALVKHKLVIKNGEFTLKDICLVAGLGDAWKRQLQNQRWLL